MEGVLFCSSCSSRKNRLDSFKSISDGGDENAQDEFNQFLEKYKFKSVDLIDCFLKTLLQD